MTSGAHGHTIGWLDVPAADSVVGPEVRVRGWALSNAHIRAVVVRIGARDWSCRIGLLRDDVATARPGYPDNPHAGFEGVVDVRNHEAPEGVDRRTLSVVAIARDGTEKTLGERTLVEPAVHARWRFAARDDVEPFHLVPALSGVTRGAAFGLDTRYAACVSSSLCIGMRVPILYLRTTFGADGDYRFDPRFDTARTLGGRAIADDALADVLDEAAVRRLPVLVTLNGGIWADSAGSVPDWDLCDRLEQDPNNCQWNERNEVMPDDCLEHLPGSQQSPQLARALTLNVFAHDVRRHKKRNLQQAARVIAGFLREHPGLVIGVNLDPDVYVNPFFAEAQWYDYNPGTLRQFRHWLVGTGPYAGDVDDDVPDLSAYRRASTLTLSDVRALAQAPFAAIDDIDPPRVFSRDPARPFWRDPWVREWETFRRHLVALHYDEMTQWCTDAGIPGERIWSSQGLMAPADDCMPLARSIRSPVKNYDSGGVSIEGSKPRGGRLGAIVYGESATNTIQMEGGGTLFAALAQFDPDFALVEFNTADLRHPERLPTYADAYRALRDAWNAGARFVSPMAWNGSNGLAIDDPAYVSYTAWRNTPLEDAARDFLLARAALPRGSRLWTFGSQVHADDDGWRNEAGALRAMPGAIEVHCGARSGIELISPPGLALRRARIGALVLGVAADAPLAEVRVLGRPAGRLDWRPIAAARSADIEATSAGALVRCAKGSDASFDRLRIEIDVAPAAALVLRRIAILERS